MTGLGHELGPQHTEGDLERHLARGLVGLERHDRAAATGQGRIPEGQRRCTRL